MPKKYKKQDILPDPVYNNLIVASFINHLMKNGKKSVARKILYGAFEIIKSKTKEDPMEVFDKAIEAVSPSVEVRPQRVGGATYQVPREVNSKRRLSLAMRWIINAARAKKGKPMQEKLAQELILASKNEGDAIKKKINVHKMAEANKAFAHLAH
ncbi:30S ribosomal protein S7 [bacterium]|nr:30S ribosomal protein S7 [bacterium]